MSRLEQIYLRMPPPIQHLLCNVEGWRVQHSRYGPEFDESLRAAEQRQEAAADAISEYRDFRLRQYLQHCADTVPFYSEQFARSGFCPGDVRRLSDLAGLPLLTKDTVRERGDLFTSGAVRGGERRISHTSGTTGAGLRFYTTASAVREQWAVWWRYRRWHGIERSTWCGYFGGRSVVPASVSSPPFWRDNYAARQIMFSAHHMSARTVGSYIAELRRRKPPWLHGYPSSLALLAGFLKDSGGDLGYQVRWITTGAENLLSHQKRCIAEAFGIPPKQHYGLAEGVANASECECGTLHVDEDFAAVEFLPAPGGRYRLVGTGFSNPATALVRYDTQDLVELRDETCRCGRPGRLLASIDGRQEDYIVLNDGSRLGRLDHIFKDQVAIREAQFRQRRMGELIVCIVPTSAYSSADEARLIADLRQRIGDRTDLQIEHLPYLPRTASGKLRLVVSDLSQAQIQPEFAGS